MHAPPILSAKPFLQSLFEAAIASAQPALCVPKFLPTDISGRLVVVGAGKASAAMARAVEHSYDGPLEGLVVTRYGYSVPCEHIEIVEAAHPVPDEAGFNAAQRMMDYVADLGAEDTLLVLISGGGSALLPMPVPGLSLTDKQAINRQLLASGATIREMNCVRRHLSQIKGGRLAQAAAPARIINLLISDVPGDRPIDIASGPTVAETTTVDEALAIIQRYALTLPEAALRYLEQQRGQNSNAANPIRVETHMVATPQMALEAAAELCHAAELPVHILSDCIEGEATDVATVMAGLVKQIVARNQPFSRPCVLLSGGETTVTLKGNGRGGRNVEFLLALATALEGMPGVYALAGDTDGVDGMEEIAGAYIDPTTLNRARQQGINPRHSLSNNDGHNFFETLGDSIVTGPTLTNVNDFRAILITVSEAQSD